MSNSLVDYIRQSNPDDSRTDDQLTYMLGTEHPDLVAKYPDAQADFNRLQADISQATKPGLAGEFGRGVSRGVDSLENTGEGALALLSGAVGAQGARDYWLEKARQNEQDAAQNNPSVQNVEDIHSFGDFTHWLAGQAGEIAPNVAEAGISGLIGAAMGGAAGTVAEPGGGTLVGGAGGLAAGIVEKSAVKSLLKKLAEDEFVNSIDSRLGQGATAAARTALQKFDQGAARDVLDQGVAKAAGLPQMVADESSAIAKRWGEHIAQSINFTAQSAGSIYNDLTKKKDFDPDTAINTAILGGLAAALPAQFLPSYITSKIVPGVTAETSGPVKNAFYSYLAKSASEAAKTVPGGVASLDLQEFATMAAEKYADPGKRQWTDEDWSRLKNASASGALMGVAGAALAGLGSDRPLPKGEQPPAPTLDSGLKNYTGIDPNTPEGQKEIAYLTDVANREAAGDLAARDQAAQFRGEQANAYSVIKGQVEAPPVTEPPTPTTDTSAASSPPTVSAPVSPEPESPAVPAAVAEPATPEAASPVNQETSSAPASSDVPAPAPPAVPEPATETVTPAPAPGETGGNSDAMRQASVDALNQADTPAPVPVASDAGSPEDKQAVIAEQLQQLHAQQKESPNDSGIAQQIDDKTQELAQTLVPVEKAKPAASSPASTEAFLSNVGFDSQNLIEGTHRKGAPKGATGVKKVLPDVDETKRIVTGGPFEGEHGEIVPAAETPKGWQSIKLKSGEIVQVEDEHLASLKAIQKQAKLQADSDEAIEKPAREAFFDVSNGSVIKPDGSVDAEKLKVLGEDLTSRSAPTSDAKNTDTHRSTAFLSPDGSVAVLPTYETSASERGGKTYRVAPLPGEAKGGKLESLLKRGYKPLASFWLAQPVNALDRDAALVFPNRAEFESQLAGKARDQMLASRRTAEAVAEKMVTSSGKSEHVETGEIAEHEPSETDSGLPQIEFSDELASGLHEELSAEIEDGKIPDEAANSAIELIALNGSKEQQSELRNLIHQLGKAGHSPEDAIEYVKNRLIQAHRNGGTSEEFIKSLASGGTVSVESPDAAAPNRGDGTLRSAPGPQSAFPKDIAKNSPGQPGQEGQTGNQVADQSAADVRRSVAGDGASTPAQFQSTEQSRAQFNGLARRLAEFGIPVNIAQQVHASLVRDFLDQTGNLTKAVAGGMYDRAARTITAVLRDVSRPSPEDFRVLLEEAGHHVFLNETAEMQSRIQRAMMRMTDQDLGVTRYSKSANPGIQAEERLMAAVSHNLAKQSFDPLKADSVAQVIVRTVKDLYLRAAMAVQRALLGENYSNPDLARRYMENRLESFLSGDSQRSLVDWLGGGKPNTPKLASWHGGEEQWRDGQPVYDHTPDDSLAAARFNIDNLRFSKTADSDESGDYSRFVEVEKLAALYNHQLDLIDRAAKLPEVAGLAGGKKIGPRQFLLSALNLADPSEMKESLKEMRESDGSPVQYDSEMRLDQFKGKANLDDVNAKACANLQKIISRLGNLRSDASAAIDPLKARFEQALQRHDEAKANYADADYIAKNSARALRQEGGRLFAAIRGQSKREGVIEQQLKALDPSATVKDYADAFQKLFTGDQLKGQKLFNLLEPLARDSDIDFEKPIGEIRAAMSGKPEFAPFLQNNQESRALLSTLTAFAKTHAQTMANLELRRLANGEERARIVKYLDTLKSDKEKFIQALGQTRMEDKVRRAYSDSLNQVRSLKRQIANAEARAKLVDAVLPVFTKEQAERSAKLDIAADSIWRDQMPYNVPPAADSSSADVAAARQAIHLDTSQRTLSNPAEVESDLKKMADFLAFRERKFAGGDLDAKDSVYQGVKRQFNEIVHYKNFRTNVSAAQRFMMELACSPVGKKVAEAFGTPAARTIERMVNHFVSEQTRMRPEAERIGRRNDQLEDALLKLLPDKLQDKRQQLRNLFLNPAKKVMQSQHDLEERYPDKRDILEEAIYNRVKNMLVSNTATGGLIAGHEDEFMAKLRNLLEFQHHSNKFLLGQVENGVLDPKLRVFNPATGKTEEAIRRHIPQGAYTFSQTLSSDFRLMVNALRQTGWASADGKSLARADFSHIEEVYGDKAKLAALVGKYFNSSEHPEYRDTIQRHFFRALAEMETESPFDAPPLKDGVTHLPADVNKVRQAYEAAAGDPIAFAERLFELHQGSGDKGHYVQDTLTRMADIAAESDGIMRKIEPDPGESRVSVRGMSANAMINARSLDHLPGTWFDYHSFDQRDMMKTVERIASQTAFGRGQERLGVAFDTLLNEVNQGTAKLTASRQEVMDQNPAASPKAIERLLQEKLGKDEYSKLSKFAQRRRLAQSAIADLSHYFRRDNAPDGTLRALTRCAHLLGNLLVQQPGSALIQFSKLMDLNLRYGASPSTLKATFKAGGTVGKELAASLAQAVGAQIFNEGEYHRRYVELGLSDPGAYQKLSDAFARLDGESRPAQFFRGAQDAIAMGVNRVGDTAQHTVFRPFSPFEWMAIAGDKALTEGMWSLASRHVMRGMEFYRDNPQKLHDDTFKLSAESLKLSGAEKDSFARLSDSLDRWGLNYDDLARDAVRRDDNTVFTNETLARLYSMMTAEVSSESSIATMPLAAYNNSLARFALPLLGWSFRRMQQISSLRLDTEGQFDLKALGRGMAGLAVISGGGLALSALIDEYYKNLLGKERNLRPVLGEPDVQQTTLGLLENLNRIGTLGFFGELANGLMNVGQGGDNRMLTVDGRVVAIQSAQAVQQAISAWVNQDYNADYAHVVRPLASAMGGGALLQYIQLANHALDLDNMESRVTARINAQNYLRVVGRQLQLDVRVSDGGYSSPTPLTPYLTEMELAAYKNNPADFQNAYAEAVNEARKSGKEDPVDYVKRAFATRNPLRNVFRTPPSETEYRQLLSAMNADGRRDVSEAVRLVNAYGERIGVKPFDGKTAKPKSTLEDFRQRAASVLRGPDALFTR